MPITLEVKYVGQTEDLEQRVRGRMHKNSGKYNGPLAQWLRSLGYLRPYKVILERGINRRITLHVTNRDHIRGRRPSGVRPVWISSVMETKWIKRFRKTVLNKRAECIDAALLFTNPPLQWDAQ